MKVFLRTNTQGKYDIKIKAKQDPHRNVWMASSWCSKREVNYSSRTIGFGARMLILTATRFVSATLSIRRAFMLVSDGAVTTFTTPSASFPPGSSIKSYNLITLSFLNPCLFDKLRATLSPSVLNSGLKDKIEGLSPALLHNIMAGFFICVGTEK